VLLARSSWGADPSPLFAAALLRLGSFAAMESERKKKDETSLA